MLGLSLNLAINLTDSIAATANVLCGWLLHSKILFELIRTFVRCGRMSGLLAQLMRLLALMVSTTQVPNRFTDNDVSPTFDGMPWCAG